MRVWDGFMNASRVIPLSVPLPTDPANSATGLVIRDLEYLTGFVTHPTCTPDYLRVSLPLPVGATLQRKPGCPESRPEGQRLGARLKRWFRPQ